MRQLYNIYIYILRIYINIKRIHNISSRRNFYKKITDTAKPFSLSPLTIQNYEIEQCVKTF